GGGGPWDLLKLEALTLRQYSAVVILDQRAILFPPERDALGHHTTAMEPPLGAGTSGSEAGGKGQGATRALSLAAVSGALARHVGDRGGKNKLQCPLIELPEGPGWVAAFASGAGLEDPRWTEWLPKSLRGVVNLSTAVMVVRPNWAVYERVQKLLLENGTFLLAAFPPQNMAGSNDSGNREGEAGTGGKVGEQGGGQGMKKVTGKENNGKGGVRSRAQALEEMISYAPLVPLALAIATGVN
ncbi:unnamed protein product, partial [Discosporangium mesarthrocarpum]